MMEARNEGELTRSLPNRERDKRSHSCRADLAREANRALDPLRPHRRGNNYRPPAARRELRARRGVRFRALGGERLRDDRLEDRHRARGNAGRTVFDAAVRTSRWRDSSAHRRLAQGQRRSAGDRRRRSLRGRSGRRRARPLAARPQPPGRRRAAATVYARAAQGVAPAPQRAMIACARTLAIMLIGVSATVSPGLADRPPWLIWNASASVPIGLYAIRTVGAPRIGDLVVIKAPEPLASFLADRGYLPRGVPLVKHVAAVPGQSVCRNGLMVSVDAVTVGEARERDSRGRPLPAWQGCRVIAVGEVFLMNASPDSLDGRYFGPLPATSVVGRAAPLWTHRTAEEE